MKTIKKMSQVIAVIAIIMSVISVKGQPGWNELTSGTSRTLNSVYFTDDSTGYAVGTYKTILKTVDGGASWSVKLSSSIQNPQLRSIYFINKDTGYAVGSAACILKTVDGGEAWTTPSYSEFVGNETITSIYFTSVDTGYVVSNGIALGTTTDGGDIWVIRSIGTDKSYCSMYFTSKSIGYAVGSDGTILKTTDAGVVWSPLSSGTSETLYSIYFTDVDTAYAVGNNGTIINTTDAGATWNPLSSGVSKTLRTIYFKGDIGYSAGMDGTIIKTVDGGVNWTKTNDVHDPYDYYSSFFINDSTGYLVGEAGIILKSTNGGTCLSIPNIDAGPDVSLCYGHSILLTASCDSLNSTYYWSGGIITQDNTVSPLATTTYGVIATNNGCSAFDDVTVTVDTIPAAQEICYVEFDTITQKNSIHWKSNLAPNIDSIKILYEESTNVWKTIGMVSADSSNFIDTNSNPQAQSYSYKIVTVDTCANETDSSAFHTTITLLATYDLGTNTYGFTWSAYVGLSIPNYILYGINSVGNVTEIGSVTGNQYFYNYVNPDLSYMKYFVGFVAPDCSSKTDVLVKSNWIHSDIATNTQDYNLKNSDVSVYPNPLPNPHQNVVVCGKNISRVTIYSAVGEKISEYTLNGVNSFKISGEQLSSGMYIVEVHSNNLTVVKKLIVQ